MSTGDVDPEAVPTPSPNTEVNSEVDVRVRASVDPEVETELPEFELRWVEVANKEDSEPDEGATVMPLFPMRAPYLLYEEPTLNIFEPQYRKMYDDILFSGSRRFAVVDIDPKTGRLAEVGVVFYLENLKEVSGQTEDRVKYVGEHRVISRIKLERVLNPSVMKAAPGSSGHVPQGLIEKSIGQVRDTYLKAQVQVFEDVDEEEISEEEHARMVELVTDLVKAQAATDENPRFTEGIVEQLDFKKGSDTWVQNITKKDASAEEQGFWKMLLIWQAFLKGRAEVLGQKMQMEIQRRGNEAYRENKIPKERLSPQGTINLEDLSPELQQEVKAIRTRYEGDVEELVYKPELTHFQATLQSNSHRERLSIFRGIIEGEIKRLQARAALKSLFNGVSS